MGIDPNEYRIAMASRPGRSGLAPAKPRVAKSPKEREIQRAILDYLALVPGVSAWRNNTGAMFGEHKGKRWAVRFGAPGISDILGWRTVKDFTHQGCCHKTDAALPRVAHFLAIEVKRPGTYPTPAQAAFLETVKAAGGIAIVARSVEDVRRALGL